MKTFIVVVNKRYVKGWDVAVAGERIVNTNDNIYICIKDASNREAAIRKASRETKLPEKILMAYEQLDAFVGLKGAEKKYVTLYD